MARQHARMQRAHCHGLATSQEREREFRSDPRLAAMREQTRECRLTRARWRSLQLAASQRRAEMESAKRAAANRTAASEGPGRYSGPEKGGQKFRDALGELKATRTRTGLEVYHQHCWHSAVARLLHKGNRHQGTLL